MSNAIAQEKTVIGLTCNETRLLLQTADANKPVDDMHDKMMEAISHYHKCKECKNIGMSVIIGLTLSCQEVLETAASDEDGRLLYFPMTLKELVAREHLWGRIRDKEAEKIHNGSWGRGDYYFFKYSCDGVCQKFREHVLAFVYPSPRSLSLELSTFRSFHILFLIPLFVDQGWSVEALFDLHQQFLFNCCDKGEDTRKEFSSHIAFLQSVLLKQIKERRFNCKEAFERAEKIYEYYMDRAKNALK